MPKNPEEAHGVSGPDTTSHDAIRSALAQQLDRAPRVPCVPPPIPDHVLLRPIGAGAYGEVWLARNALGTLRAVKIVYRSQFDDERPFEREFRGILKYEPISRTHEGLVQVLHVGRNDQAGCFYYMMELADPVISHQCSVVSNQHSEAAPASGSTPPLNTDSLITDYSPRTLRSEILRRGRLPPPEAAHLAVRLVDALAHLHSHGLVHRDVKPSNVIFVEGRPKLADIGLVTVAGSSRSYVGTEGFVPPEGPGTPQADLYALGKTLYESVTGRDRMDFPQLPPGFMQWPEREAVAELNEVVTRACAPDPRHRYLTANQFQAELNLFLAGHSLSRARKLEATIKGLKRFSAAACVIAIVSIGTMWLARVQERHARERAQIEITLRSRAQTAERDARQQLFSALLEQARATVRSGEMGQRVRALDALRRAAAISNSVELRREAFAALALPDLRFERELLTGPDFTLVQLDPRFERVALCHGRGPVEIRSVSDHRLLTSLPASTNLMAHFVRWSANGQFLAVKRDYDSSGVRADVEIWEVASARRILLLRDVPWGLVSFHPHLPQMIATSRDGPAAVWNLEDGTRTTQFKLPAAPFDLKYSPDGGRFVLRYHSNNIGAVSFHNAADAGLVASQTIPRGFHSLEWHPTGRWVAAGGDDGSVNLIDSQTAELHTLGRHMAAAATTAFSPDGRYLITGGWERELICWDLQTMQRAFTMPLGSFRLQFDANGRQCAVVIVGKSVQLYAFEQPTTRREFPEDLGAPIHRAAFSPDGRWLAASGDKQAGVWDLAGGGPAALDGGAYLAYFLFTPDARELFGSRNKQEASDCFRWQLTPAIPQSGTEGPPILERLPLYKPAGFTFLGLSSNAVVMTSSKGSQVLTQQEIENGTDRWGRTQPGVNGVSPDGRWLAIHRPYTSALYIYRLPGLERVTKLMHPTNINDFAFSPLGDEVAIWSSRAGVEFWSTTTWEQTRVLTNFTHILYATDPRSFWLRKDWRTAGLYDARTLEPFLLLPAGTLPLALSADGRQLAVSVDARRLQVWNLDEVRARLRELGLDWKHP